MHKDLKLGLQSLVEEQNRLFLMILTIAIRLLLQAYEVQTDT